MFERMDEVAPALLTRPVLDEYSAFYLQAFNQLSRARTHGMDGRPQAISLSEIMAYCDFFEVEEKEQFFKNISAADDVYIGFVEKANQKNGI